MQTTISASSATPLKLGFIGGSIHSAVGYSHFISSGMDRRWQLVAGCFSKNTSTNNETAIAYGVSKEHLYDTWQAMLAKEKGQLDAIVILTPTPDHSESVIACMRAGFAVICEKSLAVGSEQARQILDVRNELNAFLAVTYNYSGYPMLRELAKRISDGKLGKVIHFQAEMPQEGFIRVDAHGNKPAPQSWRLSDGDIPTLHLDLAVHLHQIIYYLTKQKPLELVSDQNHYGWFSGVVDNASCLCRYTSEIQGQLWFSKSALGHRNGLKIRIYGDQGSAEWVQSHPEELMLAYVDGRREVLDRAASVEVTNQRRYNRFKAGHPAGFVEAFANLYADIADALQLFKNKGEWHSTEVFSAELALEGMYFLEAMVASAKTRAWQTVGSSHGALAPVLAALQDVSDQHHNLNSENSIDVEIKSFILRLLEKKSKLPEKFNDGSDFIKEGIVDSIGIIKFILELESRFDIEINETDIETDDFRSVRGLVGLIRNKLTTKAK
ncbi:Gfo/Idh/MocA family oxidoreductase [Undibacterium sp. RTI2.1]|uniref:Gfo/Idh/MocA family protein n=1 Tax=unclassified Undibacterium TaxID=2630295 RepID=UPI002AB51D26|nr:MULTISPECIES: Gfo/Idh/MocA family oxidoreductase [unclassified Undibacterium]MDY7537139.1 Gfo/Idh/MocA family oxidoreductase [Undibacterium sp. 5I1]MEB0029822.1 Gfo/Idh/MocA family oxidoreductase [Undibacterium sp. RTI2.1]MEB0115107.1 Gfo/Idh/MocA family oxidoreductase [Undibacterium sp. RTI2.2]MEB0229317.1 Gfo/Idh/MocA family oxidoreductase [Undibacterium sp. 10I3]MEB0256135.1 Gfo/Idh/MocA family oxidoreductase [Undibacterium sp. 5I1]